MQFVTKDITTVEIGLVCHVVNNRGVMGAGVAKAVYTRWPCVREEYMKLPSYHLGTNQYVRMNSTLVVVNMIAQDGFGRTGQRYLNYDALTSCLQAVDYFAHLDDVPVYLPHNVGCGLAGGDWDIVLGIIERTVPDAIICKKE